MIDDIVEMVLKEARARDRKNPFNGIHMVMLEVFHRANWIIVEHTIEERRKEHDENKG
jgi:hypothetical protein